MIKYFARKVYSVFPHRNEQRELVDMMKDPCQLEKLLLTPLSEIEKRFDISEERNDLGLYPADGC